jgi:phage gp36-like protein
MGNYTTVEKVGNQVPFLGVNSDSDITSAQVAQYITFVGNVIDSKLSQRYAVPFTSTPPVVETIATDLTTYRTLKARGFRDNDESNEWVKSFKDESSKLLDALAAGSMSLVDSSGTIVSTVTTFVEVDSNTKNYKPVFDMRDPVVWEVDPDRIDDENNEAL